jgi:hypothetical protein
MPCLEILCLDFFSISNQNMDFVFIYGCGWRPIYIFYSTSRTKSTIKKIDLNVYHVNEKKSSLK